MCQRIDCEGIGLVCENRVPIGDDATLAHRLFGLVEVGWIVVGERRLVEAGVLRFHELLDAEELHVAVDRAAHLFTEGEQVLLVRKGVGLAGDELARHECRHRGCLRRRGWSSSGLRHVRPAGRRRSRL